MNLLRLLGAASSTIVCLSACTTSAPPETVGAGGSGTGGSVSSSGTGSPAGTGGSTWKAAPELVFGKMALASAGHDAALAYVESTVPAGNGLIASVIRLQRLDAAGGRRGAAIELGQVTASSAPRLTIASDGTHYLACWDDATAVKISCALAPVAQGPSLPVLSLAGLWPSLVHSAGAWTLAYGVPGNVAVAHVAGEGSLIGPATLFPVEQPAPPKALIAATTDGFALLSAPTLESGEDVYVHRLNSAFAPLGAPIDLGVKLWLRDALAIAVNGARIVVSVPEPYGSHQFFIDDGAITLTLPLSEGSKMGPDVALTVDGASFGRLAQNDNYGPLLYTTFAGDQPISAPQEPESDHAVKFYESNFAVLPIDGKLVFASTFGPQNKEIIVAGVHRP